MPARPIIVPAEGGAPVDVQVPGLRTRLRACVGTRAGRNVCFTLAAWAPAALFLAAYWPGVLTFDSIQQWREAVTGEFVDAHPPLHTAFVSLVAALTGSPGPVVALQSLFLAAAIVSVGVALHDAGVPAKPIVLAVAVAVLNPATLLFAVTLWKDIPYTAALLLVGASVIRLATALRDADRVAARRTVAVLTAWATLLALLRQNGVIVVGVVFLAALIVGRSTRGRLLVGLLTVAAVFGAAKFLAYPALGVAPTPPIFSLSSLVHDVAAVVADAPGRLDPDDLAYVESVAPVDAWRDHYTCYLVNELYLPGGLRIDVLEADPGVFLAHYPDIVLASPGDVLEHRLCVGSLAWRPFTPTDGYLYTGSRGVFDNEFGIATDTDTAPVRAVLDAIVDRTEHPTMSWLFWRAPVWVYAAYAAVALSAFRRRDARWLVVAAPVFGQQLAVLVLNVAQDARYMTGALLLGTLLLPNAARGREVRSGGRG